MVLSITTTGYKISCVCLHGRLPQVTTENGRISNFLMEPFPKRALGIPPLDRGPTAGMMVDLQTLEREFLEDMSWSLVDAKPSTTKLIEIGLGDIVLRAELIGGGSPQ